MTKRLFAFGLALILFAPWPLQAAASLEDDRGKEIALDALPERVVALTWSMTEQLLELGVVSVAVADPEGYRKWVVRPRLPESVRDAGLRQDPNIERIAELAPDVILAADDQIALVEKLETVAPVIYFDAFQADHDNQAAAREIYRTLAELFDKQEHARARIDALDRKLASLRDEVQAHFDGDPPQVTIVRFLDTARLVVHGKNAMPSFALDALGIENGYPLPPSDWGITIKRIQDLARVEDGVLLYMEPFPQAEELFSQPVWRALPIVRTGHVKALPSTWTYGGPFSIGYLAEGIVAALQDIETP